MTVDQLLVADAPSSSSASIEDRLDKITRQIELLVEADRRRSDLLAEVTADLTPILRQAVSALSVGLEDAEQRGYLDFGRELLGLADRVATSFTEPSHAKAPPKSIIGLARQLRDPDVRHGLDHLLGVLRSMGESHNQPNNHKQENVR